MSQSEDEIRDLIGKLQAETVGHSYGNILSALVHVAAINIIEAADDIGDARSLSAQFANQLGRCVSATEGLIGKACSCGVRP